MNKKILNFYVFCISYVLFVLPSANGAWKVFRGVAEIWRYLVVEQVFVFRFLPAAPPKVSPPSPPARRTFPFLLI